MRFPEDVLNKASDGTNACLHFLASDGRSSSKHETLAGNGAQHVEARITSGGATWRSCICLSVGLGALIQPGFGQHRG